jgi:hypothetical protein
MKIFIDTEFIDLEDDIDLLSLGLVREDGKTYYAELYECDKSRANEWVKHNVLPHLTGPIKFKKDIASDLIDFCGPDAEFWAYGIPELDYNLIMRLLIWKIPSRWSKGAYDVMSVFPYSGIIFPPEQKSVKHHALNDALWAKEIYERGTQ